MLNFEKPEYKITEYIENNDYGKFELEPLERGYGDTIGNALRRVMLSSLPGSAIVAVKIEGAMHEFQTLDGIVEDVTTIVLNLKSLVVKNHSTEDKTIRLVVSKEGPATAGDIECDPDIEVINKDLVIANIAKGGKLDIEMIVSNGRGYVLAQENKAIIENQKIGFIPIDASFSPIERINYQVESARVGQNANYDKLILNVQTNGAIRPEEAVALASKIMVEHLNILMDLSEVSDLTGVMSAKKEDTEQKKLETVIEDLDFSVRAYNCLKRANVSTIGDLTEKTESEMMKIRNLGKKSLKEVIDKIKEMGLSFKEEE